MPLERLFAEGHHLPCLGEMWITSPFFPLCRVPHFGFYYFAFFCSSVKTEQNQNVNFNWSCTALINRTS